MRKIVLAFIFIYGHVSISSAQSLFTPREQSVWIDSMLEYRFEKMLPDMMKQTNTDMWVLISREYNEDPIMRTMLPSSWLSARRRTMLVFHRDNKTNEVEKIAIARYDVGKMMKGNWNIDVYPDQFDALTEYIKKKNPKSISLNTSKDFGLADGLIKSEHEELLRHLPKNFHGRIKSAEPLALAWLETRSPIELDLYKLICQKGHEILKEAFSRKYIKPGFTTTDDVVWNLRKMTTDLGLVAWFHPTVSIQRADDEKFNHLRSFSSRPEGAIIREGDLLHVDYGFTYMRMNTDQQQHFYVLKNEEKECPVFLQSAFTKSNRLQDILTSHFIPGRSGNEILSKTLTQAKSENIDATVYTHPIGFHGHAAGPTIGLWDQQQGVKGSGDYTMYKNTAYSIELNTATPIKEWNGKVIKIMLEEDGIFNGQKFYYPAGRQENIYAF
jgi:Xaa-Pro aminopeptidase